MAKIFEMDADQKKEWEAWLATRPESVQALARKYPPDTLYLLKTSGHRVYIIAYSEENTLRVVVSGQFNFVIFDRQVFGIHPEDLEECDLPEVGEPLGTMLTEDSDIETFIEDFVKAEKSKNDF